MFTSPAGIDGDLVIFVILGALHHLDSTWHNILYAKSHKKVKNFVLSIWHRQQGPQGRAHDECCLTFFWCFVMFIVTHKIWEIMYTSLKLIEKIQYLLDTFCYSDTGITGKCTNHFTEVREESRNICPEFRIWLNVHHEYEYPPIHNTVYVPHLINKRVRRVLLSFYQLEMIIEHYQSILIDRT